MLVFHNHHGGLLKPTLRDSRLKKPLWHHFCPGVSGHEEESVLRGGLVLWTQGHQ
jgi:hypothetical protein